jgi:hypothetical protein
MYCKLSKEIGGKGKSMSDPSPPSTRDEWFAMVALSIGMETQGYCKLPNSWDKAFSYAVWYKSSETAIVQSQTSGLKI